MSKSKPITSEAREALTKAMRKVQSGLTDLNRAFAKHGADISDENLSRAYQTLMTALAASQSRSMLDIKVAAAGAFEFDSDEPVPEVPTLQHINITPAVDHDRMITKEVLAVRAAYETPPQVNVSKRQTVAQAGGRFTKAFKEGRADESPQASVNADVGEERDVPVREVKYATQDEQLLNDCDFI